MKKIIDCADNYIDRALLGDNNNLGIIFPNACGGHFLYTFYSRDPAATLLSSRIDKFGTAHQQIRNCFDFFSGHSNSNIAHDKTTFGKDFLAHYRNDKLTREMYPNYFLISIQISPEMILLHVYMMLFKTFDSNETDTIFASALSAQYNRCEKYFSHLKKYNYSNACDLTYTTQELYYNKTINPRLQKYRLLNRRYVDEYIDFFAKFQDYFSKDFREQYKFEKEFIDKYREKLYI